MMRLFYHGIGGKTGRPVKNLLSAKTPEIQQG
jgi:hypothetical protein